MMPVPVYILNLPDEAASYAAVIAQLQDSNIFELNRVQGIPGRALPDAACLNFTRDPNSLNNKGALGCFFTHVKAWDQIAAGSAPYSVVLEDDVACRDLTKLVDIALPEDFDVVFINDRTSGRPDGQAIPGETELFDIELSLPFIEKHGKSVGGDGYVLTPRGAGKLLNFVRADGYFSHVDLRIFAYCLSAPRLEQSNDPGPVARDIIGICRVTKRDQPLRGYALRPALVAHKSTASRRSREDAIGRERRGI